MRSLRCWIFGHDLEEERKTYDDRPDLVEMWCRRCSWWDVGECYGDVP